MNLTQGKPHLLPLRATRNDLGTGQGVCDKHTLIVLLQTYKPSVWECRVILMLFPTRTATHVNTSYVQVSGGLFSQLNMGAGVDVRMSLNSTAHQNVYFRAILTSLTKSINGNLNIPHILRMFTEGNHSKLTHILEYSLSSVFGRKCLDSNLPTDTLSERRLTHTQTEARVNAHAQKDNALQDALLMKLPELYPNSKVSRCC